MYYYRVCGKVGKVSIHDDDADESSQLDDWQLGFLDGLIAESALVDYMYGPLEKFGFEGGNSEFVFEDCSLYIKTTYFLNQDIGDDSDLMNALVEYTGGQLSDGWGEGYEQNPCGINYKGKDVYVSPWHPEQYLSLDSGPIEDLRLEF